MPKFPKESSISNNNNDNDINSTISASNNSFYSCDFKNCNREFNSKRNLVDHCRGHHEGKKPHLCSFPGCGKSFLRPAHLLIHNRIHTGEKPFICEFEGCGKRWNQKSALKQHIRSHTGEKPFECTFNDCKKKFSTSSSCKRHVSTHYGTNPSTSINTNLLNNEDLITISKQSSGDYSNLTSPTLSPSSFVQYWNVHSYSFDSPSHSSSSSDEEIDTVLLSNFKNSSNTPTHPTMSLTTKMNLGFLLN